MMSLREFTEQPRGMLDPVRIEMGVRMMRGAPAEEMPGPGQGSGGRGMGRPWQMIP